MDKLTRAENRLSGSCELCGEASDVRVCTLCEVAAKIIDLDVEEDVVLGMLEYVKKSLRI